MSNLNQVSGSNHFLLFFMMIISFPCLAQDSIFRRNKQLVLGYVTEVSDKEIKYRKFSSTEGTIYIENTSEIEKIKYRDGNTDVFLVPMPWELPKKKVTAGMPVMNEDRKKLEKKRTKYLYGDRKINEKQMHQLLLSLNNPQITKEVRRAKTAKGLQYIGFGAIPATFLGSICLGLENELRFSEDGDNGPIRLGAVFFGGAAAFLTTAICFKISHNRHNEKAVKLYNQQFR